MKRLPVAATLVALGVLGIACGEPSGPTAGNLLVKLTTPNSGADSAIVLTITGPAGLTSATAGPGLRLFAPALGGDTTRFALVGQLTQGAVLLTIGVENVRVAAQYHGRVDGVALPNYQLRSAPGTPPPNYSLTVVR